MIEAKNLINNKDGVISTLEMIGIVNAFRSHLKLVVDDLQEDPNYSAADKFALVGADWALDIFTKNLMFELDDD